MSRTAICGCISVGKPGCGLVFTLQGFTLCKSEITRIASQSVYEIIEENNVNYDDMLMGLINPEYGAIKFRPGDGNPDDHMTGSATDFPMMRMEEMKFIIAECDARNGDASSLVDIVSTRNPEYTCTLTGTHLIKEVLLQKRIEFWGEGIVWFDYKRCPDLLTINRGYPGTNHSEAARFNCDGLAPWFNVPINGYEAQDNKALSETNNPDPTNTVALWVE